MQETQTRTVGEGKIQTEIAFNFNVMAELQREFGSLTDWLGALQESPDKIDLNKLLFGFHIMVNEAIEIKNDESETKKEPLTIKQVGRIVTAVGVAPVMGAMKDLITKSTIGDKSKNELSTTTATIA
jgi:hypothetical protein